MRQKTLFILIAVLGVLGVANSAFAWGPATHVALSQEVLSNLALLPSAVAAILARHGLAYLYGSIAADVVFAKRMSRVKQFCHHWSTGFKVLESASDEEQQAFGYGYLSHLAADTVAHGKYIPRQIVLSQSSVNFGHLYWELRADALEPEPTWLLLDRVLQAEDEHYHAMLEQHITDTLLPYGMNRALFNSMNNLTTRLGFRRTMSTVSRLSRYPLSTRTLGQYRSECVDRIQSILSEGRSSSLLREDPSGTSTFMQLRVSRVTARRMARGQVADRRRTEAATTLAPGWIRAAVRPLNDDSLPVS
jgi:hypothetical protein